MPMVSLMRTLPTVVRTEANRTVMIPRAPAGIANWQGKGGRNNQTISVGKNAARMAYRPVPRTNGTDGATAIPIWDNG